MFNRYRRRVYRYTVAAIAAAVSAVFMTFPAADVPSPDPDPVTSTSPAPSSTDPAPLPFFRAADWRQLLVVTTTTTTTTSTTAPAPVLQAPVTSIDIGADTVCGGTAIREFIHGILAPYGIPDPAVAVISNAGTSGYGPGGGAIMTPPCETRSALAHETGHYVHDLAHGLDWDRTLQDAAVYFIGVNWLSESESSPGIERAAHCIGYVLWGYGTYTKCPDAGMLAHARDIVFSA